MSDPQMDPRLRAAVRNEVLQRVRPERRPDPHVRRFWLAPVVAIVVGALVVGASLFALTVPRQVPPAAPTHSAPIESPDPSGTAEQTAFGPVVTTLPATPVGTSARAAASDSALYLATSGGDDLRQWTIRRIDMTTGAVTTRTLQLEYLNQLVVGADGLYIDTNVIERFPNHGDTVLRLDLDTLMTLAEIHPTMRAQQDSGLNLITAPGALYVTSFSGEVRRLNPDSLATEATAQLLTSSEVQDGELVSAPALAQGRVWVVTREGVVALDTATLAVRRRIPATGVLATDGKDTVPTVLGGRLTLIGKSIVRVPAAGEPARIGAIPDLDVPTVVEVAGRVAVPLDAGGGVQIALIDASGRARATQTMDPGDGSILAGSSRLLWVLGLPGHPDQYAAIRVRS